MLAPIGFVLTSLAPLAGAYLVFVGIRDGLVAKRMLSQRNPDLYDVGERAVVRGLVFIGLGLALIVIPVLGLISGFICGFSGEIPSSCAA
jgi:hypothetical protein